MLIRRFLCLTLLTSSVSFAAGQRGGTPERRQMQAKRAECIELIGDDDGSENFSRSANYERERESSAFQESDRDYNQRGDDSHH